MYFGILTLATAFVISIIAAYYSIVGLTAIFAASVIPIIIMGGALETGKVVTAVWLHRNWNRARIWMRTYLAFATVVLMFITSMGIFGFLSKAHIEQTAANTEAVAQIERVTLEIARAQAVVASADDRIKRLESQGSGSDAQVQTQIDKEQERIDNAYKRIQPAIDEQNRIIGSQAKLYQDELDRIDNSLKTLQSYIDAGDTKKAQQMIGASADGVFGKKTAEKIGDWKAAKQVERQALLSKIEQATNNPQARAAAQEIKRLRQGVEREIAESNKLINRLRANIGKTEKTNDIDAQVDELRKRITQANAEVDTLTQQKFELEANNRKLEAEVGPVKYIAEMIYGQTADNNMLEEAVRWVIIILVLVFDPLAIVLILAGAQQLSWARKDAEEKRNAEILGWEDEWKGQDDPEVAFENTEPPVDEVTKGDPTEPGWMYRPHTPETHPYLNKGFVQPEGWPTVGPIVAQPAEEEKVEDKKDDNKSFNLGVADSAVEMNLQPDVEQEIQQPPEPVAKPSFGNFKHFAYPNEIKESKNELVQNTPPQPVVEEAPNKDEPDVAEVVGGDQTESTAYTDTHTEQPEINLLSEAVKNYKMPATKAGKVLQTTPLFKEESATGFGSVFPTINVNKGDIFLRTDYLPSRLFKWNGDKWIEISKENTSQYAYDVKYIEHLIGKLKSGEYEVEDLSETEQDQIEEYLLKNVQ